MLNDNITTLLITNAVRGHQAAYLKRLLRMGAAVLYEELSDMQA